MKNFQFNFSNPWLLLLLIPAVILTLIPYFRLAKRYRRTRNRISSIVLHLTIMLLSILTLAGLTFHYEVPNTENEILLLVDVSNTEEQSAETRDTFIENVLIDSKRNQYKVGVVTFGFDQVYAVPLTEDIDSIYSAYLDAELPDTSATNIASALTYAKDLFNNPETAKIVLITDGKETDESAKKVIRTVAAQGIRVDTVHITSEYVGEDVQIVGTILPDYHVNVGEECTIGLILETTGQASVMIEMEDIGEVNGTTETQSLDFNVGTTVYFKHVFENGGLRQLNFKVTVGGDLLEQNNVYCTSLNLQVFNKILILESQAESSKNLISKINSNNVYDIEVLQIFDDALPKTVDELRVYDQIILNNVSNKDMEDAYCKMGENEEGEEIKVEYFGDLLQSYVKDYGGGLFTVGGDDQSGESHAYNIDKNKKIYGRAYPEMLPVMIEDYKPPIGVMIIIDRSGSMNMDGVNNLEWAKTGAASCLDALDERDYVGIMTLDSQQEMILPLTQRTEEAKILAAIDSIKEANGATIFANAIMGAGQELLSQQNVAKRHIIIVTDGGVNDGDTAYEDFIDSYYKNSKSITLSIVGVGLQKGSKNYALMEKAVELGHGRLITAQGEQLVQLMREELRVPAITEIIPETFNPVVLNQTSPLVQGLKRTEGSNGVLALELDGFYGVKARSAADVILVGDYEVPVYAQWKYGAGMVGCFMCDLNGGWSSSFMAEDDGVTFVTRVINNLMPTTDIRPKAISYTLKEDNYTNELSLIHDLGKDETVRGVIYDLSIGDDVGLSLNEVTPSESAEELREKDFYVVSALDKTNGFTRCKFIVRKAGTYKIVLSKCDKDGNVLSTVELYKNFSYSEEFISIEPTPVEGEKAVAKATETTENTETPKELLEDLAERGDGSVIADLDDPWEIFDGFITELDRTYDPRFVFMIIASILFLLDVAARKFKFKWPHELIREYKEKKASK